MDENKRAKCDYINSFHDNADKRIAFLPQLFADGHRAEAMTLCLSYIDSFSQWLQWPSDKSGKNFVDAVVSFGGDSFMGLVHPLQAIRAFKHLNPFWVGIATHIEGVFPGPEYELQTKDNFLAKLASHLSTENVNQVIAEYWRTTTAAIAYFWLRNPSIHSFGAGSDISFSSTTYQGSPLPVLDFKRLYSVVSNLHSELRRRSETSGKWFGND